MHESVMSFVAWTLNAARLDWPSTRVLEVGAYNVNGSVREVIEPQGPREYIGTDMRLGPGVDVVCPAEDLANIVTPGTFQLVVCCEVLEHAERWREVVHVLKSMTAPGGVLILTTRSPGFPLHEYPGDFWRFTPADMAEVFADFGGSLRPNIRGPLGPLIVSDPQAPGVFVAARRPRDRADWPEPFRM